MWIIGGVFKGWCFNLFVKNWLIWLMIDFVKEGLFNILYNIFDFEFFKVFDFFGGMGNYSYEFIFCGCWDVMYVDKFLGCVKFVKKIVKELEIED